MEHLPTLANAVELHALDCAARRLSPKTAEVYARGLGLFRRFAGDILLRDVTPTLIRRFQVWLTENGFSAVYQHQIMRCLRAFLNFCVVEELLAQSPMRAIKMPKVPKKVLDAVADANLAKVLKACETRRDKALVLLLASSGVRSSEATALRIQDVDLATGSVHVESGKGGKGRITYIDAQARKAIKLYLFTRKQAPPTAPLFASERVRDAAISAHTIAQIMQRLRKASGVPVTAHALRRTFAMKALRAGVNIYVLARLMGHADINVLRQYLPMTDVDIAAAYRKSFG